MSRILFKHFIMLAVPLIIVGVMVAFMAFGRGTAIGVLAGGGLMLVSGGGLVFGISHILDPTTPGSMKGGLAVMLVVKLTVVVGLLYGFLQRGVDVLGLMVGMGLGLAALTLGVNRGSASPEGQKAMAEAEARIAKDLGLEDDGTDKS